MAVSSLHSRIVEVMRSGKPMTSPQIAARIDSTASKVAGVLCRHDYFFHAGFVKTKNIVLWRYDAQAHMRVIAKRAVAQQTQCNDPPPAPVRKKARKPKAAKPKRVRAVKAQPGAHAIKPGAKQKRQCLAALLRHSHIVGEQKDIIRSILSDYAVL